MSLDVLHADANVEMPSALGLCALMEAIGKIQMHLFAQTSL